MRSVTYNEPVNVTNDSYDKLIEQAPFAVVDFYASWCGPCQALTPILKDIASEYEGRVVVAKVNVDEEPELATRFGIRSIPQLFFYKNGQEVDRQGGLVTADDLKKRIDRHL